jgi:tripartite-type tricarboxylate transporter receptor subunit TctC
LRHKFLPLARLTLLAVIALAVVVPPSSGLRAADFPTRLITLVVTAPPGGTTDILARAVADVMARQTGYTFIIENRGGAGGNIAAGYVAKAAPDGYTILASHAGPLIVNGYLFSSMPYDMERDLAPVAELGAVPILLVAGPKTGLRNVQDLIAKARAEPGKLFYGSQGNGTTAHLTMELLKQTAKIDLVHIPYKGSAPAMTALLSGEIQVMFDNSPTVLPQVQQGGAVPLGVATKDRIVQLPDLPTIGEQGFPGFESSAWFGMAAPAKTPVDVIARLNKMVNDALLSPQMAQRAKELGLVLPTPTPEEFGAFMRDERQKWKKIVEISGATAD